MRGDWYDRRDEEEERDREGTMRRLDRTFGRGHAYAAGGGPDRYAPNRERMRDDDDFPHRFQQPAQRLGVGTGPDYGRSSFDDEPFSDRYRVGASGHLYGQHTGYGIGVDRYTGRWESTVGPHSGRGPKNFKRNDDRIRDEIADRLTEEPWIDPSDVDVSVQAGRVMLTGTVDDRQMKFRIEELVDRISGVSDVENRIKVRRDSY